MLYKGCRSLESKALLISDRQPKPPGTGTRAAEELEPLIAITIQF